jgi:tryptophan 2,3-dioxygenase
MSGESKALTYMTYLKVDELLSLQEPQSPEEHDELLFIVMHQVYELWFKQILHEGKALAAALERDDVPSALHTLKRVLTIMKTLVAQVDVLETMTPVSFSSFRDRLQSASGFQSRQFRMFEGLLGKRDPRVLTHYAQDPMGRAAIAAIFDAPSLYDSFLRFLRRRGFDIPAQVLERDLRGPTPESDVVRRVLVDIYRHHPTEAQVAERLVDLDEGIQEWRYRHVKMVERTIGMKMGTGGSTGAGYLRSTLFQPLFPDLWAIRAEL